MIGIIGAMSVETDKLTSLMTDVVRETAAGCEFFKGKLFETDAVIAVSGVGKVNAAICTQTMILKYSPTLIINSGVAGGLEPTLNVCDVVVARDVVQHDMDTSPLGDPVGFISGLDIINIPCDEQMSCMLCDAVAENGIRCMYGTVASGDVFVADRKKKTELASRFNAFACEMEGAAIGHVCFKNDIPFCVIRSISDNADDSSPVSYPEFVRLAADNLIKVLTTFIDRYQKENIG